MTYPALHAALLGLLAECDGARERDGAGFSKPDIGYSRYLASRYPAWSGASAYQCWSMLRKYRNQLSALGTPWEEIPVPDREAKLWRTATEVEGKVITVGDEGILLVAFPYSQELVVAVKEIRGAKWNGAGKRWIVPVSALTIEPLLKFAQANGFLISDSAMEVIRAAITTLEATEAASKAIYADIRIDGLYGDLYPFQAAGVAFAVQRKCCLLGDMPGLGKTVQALAAIQHLKAYPSLVVCPASVKWNWHREATKWLPGKKAFVARDGRLAVVATSSAIREKGIVIINYDLLMKGADYLANCGFQSVIFDESHYVKNRKAKRTRAAKMIASDIPIRLALTGTPVLNRPAELCSQLDILGRLGEFGGWFYFVKRYAGAKKTRFGWDTSGATNLEELNTKLRQICMVRRRKEEVLKELPPKVRTVIEVDITNREEYGKAEADVIRWLAENVGPEKAAAAARAEQLVRIETLKQCAMQGKYAAAREWVESFLESGEKLVLFLHHRWAQESFRDIPGCAWVRAEDDAAERQRQVDRFQADPECRLIVCSLMAGGVGITLTAASNVAFVEYGWNAAAMDQAEDRCHRIGQDDSVTAWWLVAKETIEKDIVDLIEAKREVVTAATDGAGAKSQESMLDELVGKLLKKRL